MIINAEQQRKSLNQAGLEMLELCISQFKKSAEAFVNHDTDLAEEVMHIESRVNALDLKIEKDCERFLALYNPVAIDFRFIISILKMDFDLERIADHAYDISKYVIDEKKVVKPLIKSVEFEKMYDTIISMFGDILTAYNDNNTIIARKVFKKDKIVNKINTHAFVVLESEIKKDNKIVGQALILLSVLKKLERIGDLLKNIAEEIIFFVDAKVLKHSKKK